MEINTCEQYVLNRLAELETTVEELQVETDSLVLQVSKKDERIKQLEEFIGKRTTYSSYVTSAGIKTLDFEEPWPQYDKDGYDLMVELMERYHTEEEQ